MRQAIHQTVFAKYQESESTMIRKQSKPRAEWQDTVESQGFYFHTVESKTYWDESACYEISKQEVDTLEQATEELHALCRHAVEVIIQRGWLRAAVHS